MQLGFRVGGGGNGVGLGHIMRCIAIAEAFREKNIDSTFVCSNYPAVIPLIKMHGFAVDVLPLNTSPDTDLQHTLQLLHDADIIIADDYGFPSSYLKGLSQNGQFIACLDDKMDRHLAVDVVIGNAYATHEDYHEKISHHALLLSGPKYLPLRTEYRNVIPREVKDKITRVLITCGGEDCLNVTQKVLDALQDEREIVLVVLVGGAYPFYNELKTRLETSGLKFELHRNVENVMPIQQNVDVAITAAGTTVWELSAVGTPMVVIQTADNQSGTVEYIQKNQMGIVLGDHTNVEGKAIRSALHRLRDKKLREQLSKKCQSLISGNGSEHVCEALLNQYDKEKVTLRRVEDKNPDNSDSKQLWEWRNDPVTREMSRNSEWIPWELHRDWYVKTMQDPNEVLLFADYHGKQMGTVRFDVEKKHSAEVSININPEMRGNGLGRKLLGAACRYGFHKLGLKEIDAEIKEKNVASIHIFESVGFQFIEKCDGIRKYVKKI